MHTKHWVQWVCSPPPIWTPCPTSLYCNAACTPMSIRSRQDLWWTMHYVNCEWCYPDSPRARGKESTSCIISRGCVATKRITPIQECNCTKRLLHLLSIYCPGLVIIFLCDYRETVWNRLTAQLMKLNTANNYPNQRTNRICSKSKLLVIFPSKINNPYERTMTVLLLCN